MPYGIWTCADGREVLFDRTYTPICERYPGQPAVMADRDEWVHWGQQDWFYDDATKDKRGAAMAVLAQWGMIQPVLERADQLYALSPARSRSLRPPSNRRQQPTERNDARQAA